MDQFVLNKKDILTYPKLLPFMSHPFCPWNYIQYRENNSAARADKQKERVLIQQILVKVRAGDSGQEQQFIKLQDKVILETLSNVQTLYWAHLDGGLIQKDLDVKNICLLQSLSIHCTTASSISVTCFLVITSLSPSLPHHSTLVVSSSSAPG